MDKGLSFGWRYPGAVEDVKALGASWMRESVRWSQVQPSRWRWNWQYVDEIRASVARMRMFGWTKLWLTIRREAIWGGNARQYQTFLRELQDRLPADVYQAENEADWQHFWSGSVEQYLETLAAAREVFGQVAVCGWSSGTTANPYARPLMAAFAEKVMREGIYDWADFHTYEEPARIPYQIAVMRTVMPPDVPLFCTEMGLPDVSWPQHEERHADDLHQRMSALREAGVAGAFWFLLKDLPGQSGIPVDCQRNGLVAADGRRKLAFGEFAQE